MMGILTACALLLVSGLLALLTSRSSRWSTGLGAGGAIAAGIAGLGPSLSILLSGGREILRGSWTMPLGSLSVGVDGVSAVFLVPIFFLTALAALYGSDYLKPYWGRKAIGWSWFNFNVLAASMVLVVVARNGLLFLVAWEGMALASFFLVMFEHEKPGVREAGWLYLAASHLGTAFLLVFFMGMGRLAGSLEFDRFGCLAAAAPLVKHTAFFLALIGFGTKAGFIPLHVWLPEAHPAAPSHVSALMSGVMIKIGIYGLVRGVMFAGVPPASWGWLLIGLGLVSGILGVAYALVQHDLKRLLAYHSVENIGIIALGLGVGVLALGSGRPDIARLGFAGALLHVVNHALFKSLLFCGTGSVAQHAGTRDMEHLGGLLKRMPWTGATFLIGSVAIVGLPPLNGFVSEFLIYYASFFACCRPGTLDLWPLVGVIAGLGLIGGLAAACFAKVFGIGFLGEPRSTPAGAASECGWLMRLPMLALAGACVAIGLFAPVAVRALNPALAELTLGDSSPAFQDLAGPLRAINGIGVVVGAGLLLLAALAVVRAWLLRGRRVTAAPTWDCGYAAPTPRMQYTASSFAQSIAELFHIFLRTRRRRSLPEGLFPKPSFLATEPRDGFRDILFRPVFQQTRRALSTLRWIQHGRLHLYILYLALTLLALLIWQMGQG